MKKKEPEVFNLLNLYQDDDDDDDDDDVMQEFQPQQLFSESGQTTPTANERTITPNNEVKLEPDHNLAKESEDEGGEGVSISSENGIDYDLVQKFLSPPPEQKCSEKLQEKISNFLAYKRQGISFNVEVRNRKDYRNPDFLRHAVRYQDIDEIGSCFSKDVFDPHGYDESDYFDAIEVDMKREMERKEQDRKKSQKVDFISGGTQAAVVAAQKVVLPSPGVSNFPASGLQSGSADTLTRDVRQNKKSKWDKVEGDMRNDGQDTLSSVGAHAALLSAANAGSGYAVFAQQKRREAEEKRWSDRKMERRS